jgi:hypothetical protein
MAHAEGDMFSFIVMSRNREDSCDKWDAMDALRTQMTVLFL